MEETPKQTKSNSLVIISGVVVIVLVLISVLAFLFTGNEKVADAANRYVSWLQAGDCDVIYDDSADELKDAVSRNDWNETCQQLSEVLRGSAEVNTVEVNTSNQGDKRGEATYFIGGTDGVLYQLDIAMFQTDNGWQIAAIGATPVEE